MKKITAAVVVSLLSIALSLVTSLLLAALAYVGLQFAHGYDTDIPTFPYWALYWLIFTIRVVLPSGNGSSSSD